MFAGNALSISSFSCSLPQCYDCRTSAALILRRSRKPRDVRMIAEQFCNRAAERAGAVAVDYAHFVKTIQEGLVEKLVGQFDGFVAFPANQIQFGVRLQFIGA